MARADFDRIAPDYDAGRGLTAQALEAWRDAVAPHFAADRTSLILDVGCGTGRFSAAFAAWFGARVLGIDPSLEMLRQAPRHASPPGVAYLVGDAQRIPLRAATCHAAWLSTVIHHIPDLPACARDLRRVLRPGAPVLIRNWFPGREEVLHFRYFPGARRIAETFPTIDQAIAAFAPAGFRMQSLRSVPQVSAASLREFRERVRLRADTTLQPLSDDEFASGMAALDADVAAETTPTPVISRLDLLVLR